MADYVECGAEIDDDGLAEVDGENVECVEADTDKDVEMAGEEYEAKAVENVVEDDADDDAVVLDDDGVVVDAEALLEATQSDPDDSDFSLDKGEIEEEKRMQEKDVKFEEKEAKRCKSASTSRSSSLEVIEEEEL